LSLAGYTSRLGAKKLDTVVKTFTVEAARDIILFFLLALYRPKN
jgi:hypothetical protein